MFADDYVLLEATMTAMTTVAFDAEIMQLARHRSVGSESAFMAA